MRLLSIISLHCLQYCDIVSSLHMHMFAGTPGCGTTEGESVDKWAYYFVWFCSAVTDYSSMLEFTESNRTMAKTFVLSYIMQDSKHFQNVVLVGIAHLALAPLIPFCLERSTHLYMCLLLILLTIPTNITFWNSNVLYLAVITF